MNFARCSESRLVLLWPVLWLVPPEWDEVLLWLDLLGLVAWEWELDVECGVEV